MAAWIGAGRVDSHSGSRGRNAAEASSTANWAGLQARFDASSWSKAALDRVARTMRTVQAS
jgi:hypothetical protein